MPPDLQEISRAFGVRLHAPRSQNPGSAPAHVEQKFEHVQISLNIINIVQLRSISLNMDSQTCSTHCMQQSWKTLNEILKAFRQGLTRMTEVAKPKSS